MGSIHPASRADSHAMMQATKPAIALPALSLLTILTILPNRHPPGPHIAQRAYHHATKKEIAMDYGLILIATDTLMAIFIVFVLNLIWRQ